MNRMETLACVVTVKTLAMPFHTGVWSSHKTIGHHLLNIFRLHSLWEIRRSEILPTSISFQPGSFLSFVYFFAFFCASYKKIMQTDPIYNWACRISWLHWAWSNSQIKSCVFFCLASCLVWSCMFFSLALSHCLVVADLQLTCCVTNI